MIDHIISLIEVAKMEAEYVLKHPEEDSSSEAVQILSNLDTAISEIEDVRRANSTLREWGNEQYERASEEEQEKTDAFDREEALKDRISGLKDYVKDL